MTQDREQREIQGLSLWMLLLKEEERVLKSSTFSFHSHLIVVVPGTSL